MLLLVQGYDAVFTQGSASPLAGDCAAKAGVPLVRFVDDTTLGAFDVLHPLHELPDIVVSGPNSHDVFLQDMRHAVHIELPVRATANRQHEAYELLVHHLWVSKVQEM